jgi:Mrp family chromosome partitioning ATPase/predicted Fe-Mo cluster-binding NifX family protein
MKAPTTGGLNHDEDSAPMTTEKTCGTCDDSNCPGRHRQPGESEEQYLERQALESRMCRIRHKVMVLSGKGGVGKSTVAVNLAAALAMAGKRVGLLDVDLHGPSVPKLLNIESAELSVSNNALYPVKVGYRTGMLSVMSIGFMLREPEDAVIWRGPRKHGLIRQFLKDVDWGELDYLVVDAPPGTGDEPLAIAQLIERADGAIIVTTPQELAVQDVRRCVGFCRQVDVPVIGVVENMSGLVCPKCGETINLFGSGGGHDMARQMGVPYLGAIPIEPEVVQTSDRGVPMVQAHPHSEMAQVFGRIVRKLLEPELSTSQAQPPLPTNGSSIRIAVPVTGGVLSSHFGHCENFVLFEVAKDGKTVHGRVVLTPPPHEPGTFPKWLHEQGATVIIAGGMGSRAQSLFGRHGIQVVVGASGGEPDLIVRSFLDGMLETGPNACDH